MDPVVPGLLETLNISANLCAGHIVFSRVSELGERYANVAKIFWSELEFDSPDAFPCSLDMLEFERKNDR
jgi:hypothetical protein